MTTHRDTRLARPISLFAIALLVAGLAAFATLLAPGTASAQGGGQPKVLLCHFDVGGEPGHLIEVAEPAVEAHMQHGDYRVASGSPGDPCPSQVAVAGELARTGLDAGLIALLGLGMLGGGFLLRRSATAS